MCAASHATQLACNPATVSFPMPPRFAEEVQEYIRVNGASTLSGLAHYLSKWGADEEDLRMALEWLVRERKVVLEPGQIERYRLVE